MILSAATTRSQELVPSWMVARAGNVVLSYPSGSLLPVGSSAMSGSHVELDSVEEGGSLHHPGSGDGPGSLFFIGSVPDDGSRIYVDPVCERGSLHIRGSVADDDSLP